MKLEGNFKGIFIELLKKLKYWNKDIFCEIGKLNLVIEIFENLFDFIVQELIVYLFKMFKDEFDVDVKIILLVGGFFECELV